MRLALNLLLAAATLLLSHGAAAQAWPNKPIRWILGYPPGGGTEFIARTVLNGLSERLGQPIVIENRPGAGAIIGAEVAAKSAPDGYTIFMADNSTFVLHLGVYPKLPYDPLRDFIPVGTIVRGYMMLVTSSETRAKTVQELIADIRSQPGKLNNASNGIGTVHHLALEVLKQRTGIDIVNIPFKGTAAVALEVISGRVTTGFLDLSAARGHLAGGKLRALAVASRTRLAELPGVPTFAESGIDMEVFFWQGIAVPANTPRDIVNRLSAALLDTLRTPEVNKRLADAGLEVVPTTPDQMAQLVRSDQAFWVPLVKSLNIKVE